MMNQSCQNARTSCYGYAFPPNFCVCRHIIGEKTMSMVRSDSRGSGFIGAEPGVIALIESCAWASVKS
ncbi:uncharacterized protein METZ01_LOCUS318215 [marine metagenome]|uniref:Uncharacterized protein n=1 Tax=marine metagenome TaxID=408172 RepID=A0A382P0K5_9ZZZZ